MMLIVAYYFVTLTLTSVLFKSCTEHLSYTIYHYDVASESEITPCNKIDKPLVVYRFTGNVMTSITTLRT